jgi:predicted outer membrane repeat protein
MLSRFARVSLFSRWLGSSQGQHLPRRLASRSRRPRFEPLEDRRLLAALLYVNDDATGLNTGASWANAYTDLQSALTAAVSGDEIWVASGTYKPTTGTDRSISFQLKSGVALYGGFAGTETTRDQRNWTTKVTTLSGAIGTSSSADNSYHVVCAADVDQATLDGFTITAGYADGGSPQAWGGGVYLAGSSPTLANLTVSTNFAVDGAGLYNTTGAPTLTNVTFSNNRASLGSGYNHGGGLYNQSGVPTLTNVTFRNNSGAYGGGIYNEYGLVTLAGVTLSGNSSSYGGGIYSSGGSARFTNVVLSDNSGTYGAGIYSGGGSVTLTNATFSENNGNFGPSLYVGGGTATIANSIVWGYRGSSSVQIYNATAATTTVTYSLVQNGWTGTGNLNEDPLFVDAGSANLHLKAGSPAVDAGISNGAPNTDRDGNARPFDGDGDGTAAVDLGAFESQVVNQAPVAEAGGPYTVYEGSMVMLSGSGSTDADGVIVKYEWDLNYNGVTFDVDATGVSTVFSAAHLTAGDTRTVALRVTDRTGAVSLIDSATVSVPTTQLPTGARHFVKQDATGLNDGSSWASAFTDLRSALTAAVAGDEIWVAAGTYLPTAGSDRSISFSLMEGVFVYGGFAGTETSRDQRDWAANVTILSGDIGTSGTTTDNSYHVVSACNVAVTVLDGFTITGGQADGSGFGGGLYSDSSSPTLANVIFSNNTAYSGGGLYSLSGAPTLIDVTFSNNTATSLGGGLYSNNASATLIRVTFSNNTSYNGGGAYNSSGSLTLTNAVFAGNSGQYGGGLYNTGTAALSNVSFSDNIAGSGESAYLRSGNVTIINSILWGTAGDTAVQLYSGSNATTVRYSIVQGGWTGTGNLNADPLFVDAAHGDLHLKAGSPAVDAGANSGAQRTDRDGAARPFDGDGIAIYDMGAYESHTVNQAPVAEAGGPYAVGVGRSVTLSGAASSDSDGVVAKYEWDFNYDGVTFDVDATGISTAFSTVGLQAGTLRTVALRVRDAVGTLSAIDTTTVSVTAVLPLYVDQHATGLNTGTSWANAFTTLQAALTAAVAEDEIWVAAGTYTPTTGTDRRVSFVLKTGVAVYGGFAGTETSRGQRNWTSNITTLSGDIGVAGSATDNSYHVVYAADVTTAVLDGFTITGGRANGSYDNQWCGGGVFFTGSTSTLANVTFSRNTASSGGGLYISSSSPTTLTNVVFSGNTASSGGGVYSYGSTTLANVTFSGNTATSAGGALSDSYGTTTITNSIFWGNTAPSSPQIDCWSTVSLNVSYSIVQGGWTGTGNLNVNPLFVDAAKGNLHLKAGSPAVDAGTSTGAPNTDHDGNSRPFDGDGNGTPAVDLGAYESHTVNQAPVAEAGGPYAVGVGRSVTLSGAASSDSDGVVTKYEWDFNYDGVTFTTDASGVSPTFSAADLQVGTTRTLALRVSDALGARSAIDTATVSVAATVPLYVDQHATGLNTGNSWANAFTDLQSALAAAVAGEEIWVAAGTYTPTTGTTRSTSFVLKTGVSLYGGFAGTETGRDQRNWTTNVTTLSGDIGAVGSGTDNSYHVLYAANVATAVVNGFTISAGYANGGYGSTGEGAGLYATGSALSLTNLTFRDNVASYLGGGMYNELGASTLTSVTFTNNGSSYHGGGMYNASGEPTLSDVTFHENSARYSGGGIYNAMNSPTLTNVTFSSNSAGSYGGGMYNYDSTSPTLTKVVFSGNVADQGGGMYCSGSLRLNDVTFSGNTADYYGGGMYVSSAASGVPTLTEVTFRGNTAGYEGGGMYVSSAASGAPTLAQVTFSGNTAAYEGGGMCCSGSVQLANVVFSGNAASYGGGFYSSGGTSTLTNVTFNSNRANYSGGGVYSTAGVKIVNGILWGNTTVRSGAQLYSGSGNVIAVSYSIVEGGWSGTGNLDVDPLFVDAANGDLRLQVTSPAVDVATSNGAPSTDRDGNSRPFDGDGDGTATCDMGAYESQAVSTVTVLKSLTANDTLLSDADAGSGKFRVTLTYTKPMDLAVAPTIAFGGVASTLTLVNGIWTDSTHYVATYDVADVDLTVASVTIKVSGARDASGNALATHTSSGLLGVDMQAPTVTNVWWNLTTIKDANVGSQKFTVSASFSEAMDMTVAPTLFFTADVSQTLTFASGSWSGSTYTAVYDVADANVLARDLGVTVGGARDAAGNVQVAFSGSAVFTIDTRLKAPDTLGVYDPSTSTFSLRSSNTTGAVDHAFGFGQPDAGWQSLTGDWNGDGTSGVGLYDVSSSTFYLTDAYIDSYAQYTFGYGMPDDGWQPLVGDWNGDGKAGVGLFDPHTSTFYLTDVLQTGVAQYTFSYGVPNGGWRPLVGDWDGDGRSGIGLYDPQSSTFYLANTLQTGNAEHCFALGAPGAGWTPMVGDWNGDGKAGVGLYDPQTSTFYLTNSFTTSAAQYNLCFGAAGAGWTPLVGDWNGDGRSGIGLYDASTSTFYLTTSLSSGYAQCTVAFGHPGAGVPLVGCWTTGAEMNAASVATVTCDSPPTEIGDRQPALTAATVDQIDLAALAATKLKDVAALSDLEIAG